MIQSMNHHFWVGVLAVLSMTSVATAAPIKTTNRPLRSAQASSPKYRSVEVLPDLSGINNWLFLGFDAGGIFYSSALPGVEGARNGFIGGGRLLISHQFTDWVMDGGLGWQYISAKGDNTNGTTDSINSKIPYLDFSIRYRLGQKFQLGPELEFWLGTDNGLNQDFRAATTNSGKFLGIEGVFEWDRNRKYRFGGRWLMGLGVPGRTVNAFQAFFQIGFDAFGEGAESAPPKHYEQVNDSDLEKAEALTPKEPIQMTPEKAPPPSEPAPDVMSTPAPPPEEPQPPVAPTPEASPAPAQDVTVIPEPTPAVAPKAPVPAKKLILSMGINDLPFGFNDTQLPRAHQARVKNMGRYLAKNQKSWKALIVSGHTDERGSNKFNMDLSMRRAETVRRLLIEGGLASGKVRAVGYGETKPLDRAHTEKAWAKNRRVELEFRGVRDSEIIKKALDQ
jgi:outer membrane protein OmpA-like peptidoglycan-associated protein